MISFRCIVCCICLTLVIKEWRLSGQLLPTCRRIDTSGQTHSCSGRCGHRATAAPLSTTRIPPGRHKRHGKEKVEDLKKSSETAQTGSQEITAQPTLSVSQDNTDVFTKQAADSTLFLQNTQRPPEVGIKSVTFSPEDVHQQSSTTAGVEKLLFSVSKIPQKRIASETEIAERRQSQIASLEMYDTDANYMYVYQNVETIKNRSNSTRRPVWNMASKNSNRPTRRSNKKTRKTFWSSLQAKQALKKRPVTVKGSMRLIKTVFRSHTPTDQLTDTAVKRTGEKRKRNEKKSNIPNRSMKVSPQQYMSERHQEQAIRSSEVSEQSTTSYQVDPTTRLSHHRVQRGIATWPVPVPDSYPPSPSPWLPRPHNRSDPRGTPFQHDAASQHWDPPLNSLLPEDRQLHTTIHSPWHMRNETESGSASTQNETSDKENPTESGTNTISFPAEPLTRMSTVRHTHGMHDVHNFGDTEEHAHVTPPYAATRPATGRTPRASPTGLPDERHHYRTTPDSSSTKRLAAASAMVQCQCDELCPAFGDCCADYYLLCQQVDITYYRQWKEVDNIARQAARAAHNNRRHLDLFSRMGCHQVLPDRPYVYMVDRCVEAPTWYYHPNYRHLCEAGEPPPPGHGVGSPNWLPWPLLDNVKIVFKNLFCAFCNGFPLSQLDHFGSLVYITCTATFSTDAQFHRFLQNGTCYKSLNETIMRGLRPCVKPSLVYANCLEPQPGPLGGSQSHGQDHVLRQGHSVGGSVSQTVSGHGSNPNGPDGAAVSQVQLSSNIISWILAATSNTRTTNSSSSKIKSVRWHLLTEAKQNTASVKISNPNCSSLALSNGSQWDSGSVFSSPHPLQRNFLSAALASASPLGQSCNGKEWKKISRQQPQKRLTSSRILCKAYKYYVSLEIPNGTAGDAASLWPSGATGEELLLANPDCLACSVGMQAPQLMRAEAVCPAVVMSTLLTANTYGTSVSSALAVDTVSFSYPKSTLSFFAFRPGSVVQDFYTTTSLALPTAAPNSMMGSATAFHVFFQLYDSSWEYQINGVVVLPQVLSCPDNQVYIPYIDDCQPMVCGPQTYPYRGRCLLSQRLLANVSLQPYPAGATRYVITLGVLLPGVAETGIKRQDDEGSYPGYDAENSIEDRNVDDETADDHRGSYLAKAYLRLLTTLSANDSITEHEPGLNLLVAGYNLSVVSVQEGEAEIKTNHTVFSVRIEVETVNGSLHDVVLFSQRLGTLAVVLGTSEREGPFRADTVTVASLLNHTDSSLCPNGTLHHTLSTTLIIDDSSSYFLQTSAYFYNLENIGFELLTFSSDESFNASEPQLRSAIYCRGDFQGESDLRVRCGNHGYVLLNVSLFKADNNTLTVFRSSDVFNRSQFQLLDNGSALVCSVFDVTHISNTTVVTYVAVMKDYMLEGTLAVTTLSLSMCSLGVLLLVYFLLPQLRSVPGVIVMSYSGSLLVSQALTLFAGYPRDVKWLCTVHACLAHASMLSTFLWKSALSFDLVFMLRLKSVENSSRASRVFMLNCYSLVGWLLPLLAVLLFWLLDHFGLYRIGYGALHLQVCWLESLWSGLFLLMLPLALTWLFNFLCFARALHIIRKSGQLQSRSISRSKNGFSPEKRRLAAYARISLLMGATWILCFLAASLDQQALWLTHIALNGSQGLYLLLCFVCKRRVCRMLRDRLNIFRSGRHGDETCGDGSDTTIPTCTTTSLSSSSVVSLASYDTTTSVLLIAGLRQPDGPIVPFSDRLRVTA